VASKLTKEGRESLIINIMKKCLKLLMASAMVLIAVNANAQLGIKAGYVSTKFTGKENGGAYKGRPMDGFKIGVDYDLRFGSMGLSLRPGINYTYFGKGQKYNADNVRWTNQQRYHFLSVPIDLKYAFDFGNDWNIYAVVGPKFVFGLGGKSIDKSNDGYKGTYKVFSGKYDNRQGDILETGNGPAEMNRFDVEIGLGLGVQYRNYSLEFDYDWGMLNLAKYDRKTYSIKRNQIGLIFGFMF
jgi:hypothetical protein